MRIAIIGGGLMGMALGRTLAISGNRVDVIEQAEQLGGLTTHHDYGEFYWDRFYHVILPSDGHLIRFVHDLGLGDDLQWRQTRTGFYVDNKMHSISNNMEFLKFPLLNLVDKARLAWTMIYSSRIRDWRKLETESVQDWLISVSGQRTYEKMWKPLLLAKLGESYQRVSAVFIWSYIRRLFSARDSSASKEQLGHVAGGYRQVFDALKSDIEKYNGSVNTGESVSRVESADSGGLLVHIDGEVSARSYDRVVCTSPVPVLRKIISDDLLQVEDGDGVVEYLGVVCVVLVTSKPVVPFYVVNIADPAIPFTGIIGMSTVVDPRFTNGKYLTYLPKYVLSDDAWHERPDAEIQDEFVEGLRKMLPDFDPSSIENVEVNRARRVQPLQVQNYSKIVPRVDTRHPDLFVLNTAQFLNATLNNNEVIRSVNEFVAGHSVELGVCKD